MVTSCDGLASVFQFSALKQSRDSEEQRLLQQQEQGEELQAMREKVQA